MFDHFYLAEVRDLTDFSSLQARRVFYGRDDHATRQAAERWARDTAGALEAKQKASGLDFADVEGKAWPCGGEVIA